MKQKTNKKDKVICIKCGKEYPKDEVVFYTIPSCCAVYEVSVCKKCNEKNKKEFDIPSCSC